MAGPDAPRGAVFEEVDDGRGTRWRFDRAWLGSNWTCLWGRGCLGIEAEPAPDAMLGCCSVGAELGDADEARTVVALAATVGPEHFEHHGAPVLRDGGRPDPVTGRWSTEVVDGACVLLNRPGFAGGAGCALHIAALAAGESPTDWKPSVCWQLPLRVEWADDPAGGPDAEVATVRAWTRADWGAEGETMAWCCTEGPRAYVGDRPVVESLAGELAALAGADVVAELARRLADGGSEGDQTR